MTAVQRNEAGAVGGLEALPFGVLVFVVGTLLIANTWAVIDAKLAANSAAREATRTYVEAPASLSAEAAFAAAKAAGEAAFSAQRDSSRRPEMTLLVGDGNRTRCALVVAQVSYRVPAVTLPWIGTFGRGFVVRARHREVVDPFRAGLPGAATCTGGDRER
jgi:hypothetical protein